MKTLTILVMVVVMVVVVVMRILMTVDNHFKDDSDDGDDDYGIFLKVIFRQTKALDSCLHIQRLGIRQLKLEKCFIAS